MANGCGIPEAVYRPSCVQYSDSCVQRSIRIAKSWKMAHFLTQTKSASPNKLVHQMATYLSYPHGNLGHLTVAKVLNLSRPVLVFVIKHTTGSVKRTLRIRI